MDSGSSGSMSSNGAHDDQVEPESLSGFLNPSSSHNSTLGFGIGGSSNPNLFSQYQTNTTPNYDLSSNYLHALSQPHPPNSNSQISFLSPNHHQLNSFTNIRRSHHPHLTNSIPNLAGSSSSSLPHQAPYGSAKATNLGRNSKKRTRASRKAPTTVMTTDTSNFRAMVQEFTGIPAPPFSSGSSSYSRRLESIFGGSRSVYPLRPSAHKVHHQLPFLSNSSSNSRNLLMSNSVGMVNNSSNVATSSTNHDMSNFSFTTTHQGLMGKELPNQHAMQSPILSAFHRQEQPSLFHYSSVNNRAKPTLPLDSLPEDDQLGMSMMSHGYVSTNLDGSTMDHQNDHHLMPNLDEGMVNPSRLNSRGGDEANVESWVEPSG